MSGVYLGGSGNPLKIGLFRGGTPYFLLLLQFIGVRILNKIQNVDPSCTFSLLQKQMDVKSLRNLRDCLSALLKWDCLRLRGTHSFWVSLVIQHGSPNGDFLFEKFMFFFSSMYESFIYIFFVTMHDSDCCKFFCWYL